MLYLRALGTLDLRRQDGTPLRAPLSGAKR